MAPAAGEPGSLVARGRPLPAHGRLRPGLLPGPLWPATLRSTPGTSRAPCEQPVFRLKLSLLISDSSLMSDMDSSLRLPKRSLLAGQLVVPLTALVLRGEAAGPLARDALEARGPEPRGSEPLGHAGAPAPHAVHPLRVKAVSGASLSANGQC